MALIEVDDVGYGDLGNSPATAYKKTGSSMSIRTIRYELEAKLTGESFSFFRRPSGKLERKTYGDGGERLKIVVRNLKVPDQSVALVMANGNEIAKVPLTKGSGRLDIESKDPDAMPSLEAGQFMEVDVDGEILLSGHLYVD